MPHFRGALGKQVVSIISAGTAKPRNLDSNSLRKISVMCIHDDNLWIYRLLRIFFGSNFAHRVILLELI